MKSKVKVKKWIDTPDYAQYHQFVLKWHDFLKKMQVTVSESKAEQARTVCIKILQIFYLQPYSEEGFYEEFDRRLKGVPYV